MCRLLRFKKNLYIDLEYERHTSNNSSFSHSEHEEKKRRNLKININSVSSREVQAVENDNKKKNCLNERKKRKNLTLSREFLSCSYYDDAKSLSVES